MALSYRVNMPPMISPISTDELRTAPQWDAFISHAWEDKESFVRPLAHALTALGAAVWYDEFSLKLGDSLSASIDRGLAGSRYGIVVLSKAFIAKRWPQRELQGLVAREMDGRSTILPVWHQLTRDDVLEFSPPLADKLAAITTDNTADQIALQILSVIRPDIAGNTPYDDLRRIATGEAIAELRQEIEAFKCPHCGDYLVSRDETYLVEDLEEVVEISTFECGYVSIDGYMRRPCPHDPKFPKFQDYTIKCQQNSAQPTEWGHPTWRWTCFAVPKTEMARLVSLEPGYGQTRRGARRMLIRHYAEAAKEDSVRTLRNAETDFSSR
jgi:TIR domain